MSGRLRKSENSVPNVTLMLVDLHQDRIHALGVCNNREGFVYKIFNTSLENGIKGMNHFNSRNPLFIFIIAVSFFQLIGSGGGSGKTS